MFGAQMFASWLGPLAAALDAFAHHSGAAETWPPGVRIGVVKSDPLVVAEPGEALVFKTFRLTLICSES